MRSYTALSLFFRDCSSSTMELTFKELEVIMSSSLPQKAYFDGTWWSNYQNERAYARAWLENNYFVRIVNLSDKRVIFERLPVKEEEIVDYKNM